MSKKIVVLLFSFIGLLQFCNTTEPPPPDKTISLVFEDVSSVEAWIKITTNNIQLPAEVTLKKNNTAEQSISLLTQDSVIYIDSLLPNQQYTFQSFIHPINQSEIESNELSVTTMDTTSHNFTFQSWTFGTIGSSTLYDVAIIDENNIWAVGEILIADTSQNGYTTYNAAHWNGSEWKVKRITVEFRDNFITPPLEGIYAFSSDDIWMVGSLPIHGDGDNWEIFDLRTTVDPNLSLSKAWGSSSNDMYFVGRSGSIARYNGTLWWKMNSGTDSNINDILGTESTITNNYLILCAASNPLAGGEKKILQINNNKVDTLLWGTNRLVHSLWFDNAYKLFACGGGIFVNNHTGGWIEQEEPPFVFTERVRGNGMNDVFVVGHFGLITHYNGAGWKTFPDAAVALVYTSVDYENNLMVTVGYTQSQAVIQFMIRN